MEESLPQLRITDEIETSTRLKDIYLHIQLRCQKLSQGRSSNNYVVCKLLESDDH